MQGVNGTKGSRGKNQGVVRGNTPIDLQRDPTKSHVFLVLSVLKDACRNIEREGEERDLKGFI